MLLLALHLAIRGVPNCSAHLFHDTVIKLWKRQSLDIPHETSYVGWRLPTLLLCVHYDCHNEQLQTCAYLPHVALVRYHTHHTFLLVDCSAFVRRALTYLGESERMFVDAPATWDYHYSHVMEFVLASTAIALASVARMPLKERVAAINGSSTESRIWEICSSSPPISS